jgi:regulator of protease activity HflC (stomatin/prohibitin superfamily)
MTKEKVVKAKSGWGMLALALALFAVSIVGIVALALQDPEGVQQSTATGTLAFSLIILVGCFICAGFFTLQPNEARVLLLFGRYRGTANQAGFFWANPFYSKRIINTTRGGKISLRARTMNGEKIKVNDKGGNPIEIAMVVVWHVGDTAQAVFDVNDYLTYVTTQSETSLRHVATTYAYDHGEDGTSEGEMTLRSNTEEVSDSLKKELTDRLAVAGVIVDDARLSHLAYAPEIAQAMLRRQQAEAVIAARRKIVEGAVGMVDMALAELERKQVLDLDDERKAAMVSNLMVILCGESEAQPIVNTGTLYN